MSALRNFCAFDWNDLLVGKEFHNKFLKNVKSPHHALPPPPHTAFTLIGNVVPFQLIRGRDIWSHMIHFCRGLTIIRILINFDLHNHYQDITNQYFRYSNKIDSNQSKSIIIYWLILKVDGNRSVKFLWSSILSISAI